MRISRTTCLLAVVLTAICIPRLSARSIESQIHEILNSADLLDTQRSLYVVDLDTGQPLVAINADRPMIPASNMKLITTAAATRVLGPDFVFRTELRLIRPNDWLHADTATTSDGLPPSARQGAVLVVVGDGDPGFFDPDLMSDHGQNIDDLLDAWVKAVQTAGVDHLNHLVIDDRVFDRQFVHPSWPRDQLQNRYSAQVSGLNFLANCLAVYVEPTELGQSPHVTIFPDSPFLSTTTRARTGLTDTFWVSRKRGTNELTFWGTVKNRRAAPTYVTINDPAMYFARLLAHRLSMAGIGIDSINRPGPEDQLPGGEVLYRVQTTLPALLARCNKDSHNLAAEALLKRMGRQVTGSPGSWPSGAAAIRLFLTEPLGARGAAVTISDGSGLSRDNRVTARLIVDLLREMYHDQQVGPVFHQSLAVGGVDGTLRKRFRGPLRGKVFAKTGYIRQVSNISGYLAVTPQPSGNDPTAATADRMFAFSLLFNNIKPPVYVHQIKNLQDRILGYIASAIGKQRPIAAAAHNPR